MGYMFDYRVVILNFQKGKRNNDRYCISLNGFMRNSVERKPESTHLLCNHLEIIHRKTIKRRLTFSDFIKRKWDMFRLPIVLIISVKNG